MIVASAYDWWVSSGRLITVPQWLSQLSLGEIERFLFDPTPQRPGGAAPALRL
jgi:hypothetical protein